MARCLTPKIMQLYFSDVNWTKMLCILTSIRSNDIQCQTRNLSRQEEDRNERARENEWIIMQFTTTWMWVRTHSRPYACSCSGCCWNRIYGAVSVQYTLENKINNSQQQQQQHKHKRNASQELIDKRAHIQRKQQHTDAVSGLWIRFRKKQETEVRRRRAPSE